MSSRTGMVDDARNSMKADHKPGFRDLKCSSVTSMKKSDVSVFQNLNTIHNVMDDDYTTNDEEEDESRNMNYQMLLIMHGDKEMRPCRPVLRVVSLPTPPNTVLNSASCM